MSETIAAYQIQKVYLAVERLRKPWASLDRLDKIKEIDKTIEVVKKAKKLVPYPQSEWFSTLLENLEAAKSVLESNSSFGCAILIANAFALIQNQFLLVAMMALPTRAFRSGRSMITISRILILSKC